MNTPASLRPPITVLYLDHTAKFSGGEIARALPQYVFSDSRSTEECPRLPARVPLQAGAGAREAGQC